MSFEARKKLVDVIHPDGRLEGYSSCFLRLSEELDAIISDGSRVLLLNCGHTDLVSFLVDRRAEVVVHFFKSSPELQLLTEQFGNRITALVTPPDEVNDYSFDFDVIVADNIPVSKWSWHWLVQQMTRFLRENGVFYLFQRRIKGLSLASMVEYFYDFELEVEKIYMNSHAVKPCFPLSRISKLMILISAKFHDGILFCCRKSKVFRGIVRSRMFDDFKGTLKQWKHQNKEPESSLRRWLGHFSEYRSRPLSIFDASTYHGQSVLILSPHPDDEVIGCGGAILQLIAKGVKVVVLQMTTGQKSRALKNVESEKAAVIRPEEAKKVAEYLKIDRLIQWSYADNEQWNQDRVDQLKDLIQQVKPKVIFLPFVNDPHPDHWAANRMLGRAISMLPETQKDMEIFNCEIWSLLKPNCAAIIDAELDKKDAALLKYTTALKIVDYIKRCRITTAYNGYTYLGQKCYAEAFLKLPANEYIKIVQQQEQWRNEK